MVRQSDGPQTSRQVQAMHNLALNISGALAFTALFLIIALYLT